MMSEVGGFSKSVFYGVQFLMSPFILILFYINLIANVHLKQDKDADTKNDQIYKNRCKTMQYFMNERNIPRKLSHDKRFMKEFHQN